LLACGIRQQEENKKDKNTKQRNGNVFEFWIFIFVFWK